MSIKILRFPAALDRLGISRSTAYKWIAEGILPRPISLGARSVGFVESEIDDWISNRIEVSRERQRGQLA